MVKPQAQRLAARHLIAEYQVSERRTSRVLGIRRSTMRYQSHPRDDSKLEERMKDITTKHRRFGLPRVHCLLHREGAVRFKSRTERVYCKLGLQIQKRPRKKMLQVTRTRFVQATEPNEIWSFNFVSDRFENDRHLKCLTFVDDCSKKTPGLLVAYGITSIEVTGFFDSLSIQKQPSKGVQNAFIESFNSRFRDECLNEEKFLDLEDKKKRIEKWRTYSNEGRPHTSFGL